MRSITWFQYQDAVGLCSAFPPHQRHPQYLLVCEIHTHTAPPLLWQDKVEGTQFSLQRGATQRSLAILSQLDKVIFSTHTCHNLGLIQHGSNTQGCCTGVFKAFAWLKYGLSSSNTWPLDYILVGTSNCLDLKAAGHKLDGLAGFAFICDTDIVRKAMFVKLGITALRTVCRGDDHTYIRCKCV